LVGPKCEGVQDDLVSGLFQTCVVAPSRPDGASAATRRTRSAGHAAVSKPTNVNRGIGERHDRAAPVDEILAIRTNNTVAPALPAMGRFEHLTDQSVLSLYDAIRHQVDADKALGDKYRLVGQAAKDRAERLKDEIVSRGLKFSPIVWT
jgi:hypothetical protein